MDIESLKELKAEFEKVRKYNDMHCMSTVTEDDVLELIDEAIARQTTTCPDCGGSGVYQEYDEYDRYTVHSCATCDGSGEIARQSATSEEVAEAIYQMNEALGTEYLESDGEWTCYNEFSTNAIRTAITALQAYQPWIPVSNPPTEFGDYLVLVKYYKGAKQIKIDVAEWYDEWKINYEWTITHWKPLPEPPKGE